MTTFYRVAINLGFGLVPVSEVLVSKSEAEKVLADAHPATNPVIVEIKV